MKYSIRRKSVQLDKCHKKNIMTNFIKSFAWYKQYQPACYINREPVVAVKYWFS